MKIFEFTEKTSVTPAGDHEELELSDPRWIEGESLGDAMFHAILHTLDNWNNSEILTVNAKFIEIDAGPCHIRLENFLESPDAQSRALELNLIRRTI
jgi:hypothetical protein